MKIKLQVLAFTDGETIRLMPPAQDHKRIGEGDTGPNTGGMGAYCPCPLISEEQLDIVKKDVLQRAVDGLKAEGIKYVGEYSEAKSQKVNNRVRTAILRPRVVRQAFVIYLMTF